MKRPARWTRAASNLLLGVALGLLSYYTLTTLLTEVAQRDLRDEYADVVAFAAEDPEESLETSAGPVLDFAGWSEQDEAYWGALAEGEAFGRIVIPGIGLDAIVMKGVSPNDLRRGPGWIDWTDLPGPTGTCGISGHRTTYGAPFRRVDELKPGDTIDLYSPYRRYRYEVTGTLIVLPSQTEVVDSTEQPTLTLTACHPPYSAAYRIAVQAKLVDVRRVEATEE